MQHGRLETFIAQTVSQDRGTVFTLCVASNSRTRAFPLSDKLCELTRGRTSAEATNKVSDTVITSRQPDH
jgi:hypothetical protein